MFKMQIHTAVRYFRVVPAAKPEIYLLHVRDSAFLGWKHIVVERSASRVLLMMVSLSSALCPRLNPSTDKPSCLSQFRWTPVRHIGLLNWHPQFNRFTPAVCVFVCVLCALPCKRRTSANLFGTESRFAPHLTHSCCAQTPQHPLTCRHPGT